MQHRLVPGPVVPIRVKVGITACGVNKVLQESEQNRTDVLLVVAAALIDANGRVLVQRRPPGKSLAGLWEFPGGKPEAGESPEVALARELNEELGIIVQPANLSASAFASEPLDGRHLVILLYLGRVWEGRPEALHATDLLWATISDLRALDMPPADYPLVDLLERLI